MPTPGSISAFPVRGYSIAEDVVCVNALVQSPLVVAGRPLNAWECYNYKPLAEVAQLREGVEAPTSWDADRHTMTPQWVNYGGGTGLRSG